MKECEASGREEFWYVLTVRTGRRGRKRSSRSPEKENESRRTRSLRTRRTFPVRELRRNQVLVFITRLVPVQTD